MHNYESKYGVFPPAYTVDKQGRRMHSWRALAAWSFWIPISTPNTISTVRGTAPAILHVAEMMKKDGPYRCPSEKPKDLWTNGRAT